MCDPNHVHRYLQNALPPIALEEFRQHLLACGGCRLALTAAQFDSRHEQGFGAFEPGEILRNLREFAARLRAEKDQGAAFVPFILSKPASTWRMLVASDERLRTHGFVSHLLARFDEVWGSHPESALEIASFAADVADTLPDSRENSKLRVLAWRKYANTLRNRGDFRAAADAYDMAESNVSWLWSDREYEIAAIDIDRASLYRVMGLTTKARACLERAKTVVVEFDQSALFGELLFAEGTLAFDAGSHAAARDIFMRTAERMKFIGAKRMEGLCYLAIGNCCADTGDEPGAISWWAKATSAFRSSGHYADTFRITEEIGRLQIGRGDVDEGLASYREAESGYEEFAKFGDAIDVSLEISEVLLCNRIQIDDAIERCRVATERALRAGMPRQAATALAHLRRAAADIKDDADCGRLAEYVRDVRRFMSDLKVNPLAEFVPSTR